MKISTSAIVGALFVGATPALAGGFLNSCHDCRQLSQGINCRCDPSDDISGYWLDLNYCLANHNGYFARGEDWSYTMCDDATFISDAYGSFCAGLKNSNGACVQSCAYLSMFIHRLGDSNRGLLGQRIPAVKKKANVTLQPSKDDFVTNRNGVLVCD
ncbi:hypothetical protein FQN54_005105 [Arachnomyces sp. PD_36]|nr:hypothetical protein FQN54_005105 [Arachnomyces sp. PD_36]